MDEATKHRWDVGLGIITPVLTVAAIVWGVWKFTTEQTHQTELLVRSNTIEFERNLWKQQLDTYASIADVVGQIATNAEDGAALKEPVKKFKSLYWGAMILVEDEAVEEAMIAFNQEVHDFQSGWSNSNRLKVRALRLIETCRTSSRETWRQIEALRAP